MQTSVYKCGHVRANAATYIETLINSGGIMEVIQNLLQYAQK